MAEHRHPAVGALPLLGLLRGPARPARVVAGSRQAAYLEAGRACVAVVASGGVQLPMAVQPACEDACAALRAVEPGIPARVGDGGLRLGALELTVTRWWDPTPRLGAVDPAGLGLRARDLDSLVPPWPAVRDQPLRAALAEGAGALRRALGRLDTAAFGHAARRLVGLGPGLTPAGDDLVAGTVAALRLLGAALRCGPVVAFASALAGHVDEAAAGTATVSAALLRHAAAGQVAEPAAEVLRALAGRGDLGVAVPRLLAVGHTSGHDLAEGLRLGAGAAVAAAAGRQRA